MSRAGAHFGHYRLDRLIGTGGMGQVWLAYDTVIERDVALKLLRPDLTADESYRRRFDREARIAASLREPHAVPIHGFGAVADHLYIDMALIDGVDAGSVLREHGPFDPDRAVDLIEQVASALDAAHRAGLLHRDVKPSNILIHESGFAYLIDFGIARREGQSSTTTTLGTFAYMAPERLRGDDGVAADVYSLTCVLFELLTGARPFGGRGRVEEIEAHTEEPPPLPSQTRPGVPATFDPVIARGMAKDPNERFRTARDLARTARAALGQQPAPARDMLRPRASTPPLVVTEAMTTASVHRRRWLIPAAGGVAAVAAAAAVVALRPNGEPIEPQEPHVGPAAVTLDVADPTAVAVDPSTGTVFVTSEDGSVYLVDGATNQQTGSVAVGSDPAAVAFDPTTGRAYIANRADGTVSVVDPASYEVVATVTVGGAPDCIAVSDAALVYVVNSADATVSVIDTSSDAVTTTIEAGGTPECVTAAAGFVYLADASGNLVTVVDASTNEIAATVETGRSPRAVVVDPGQERAYVTDFDANTVSVFGTADNVPAATIDVGRAPRGIAVDPDLHLVYVANFADGTVSVIDTTSDTVIDTIAVAAAPDDIAVDTSAHRVYVVSSDDVVVLDR